MHADLSASARAGIRWGLVTAGGVILALVAITALSASPRPGPEARLVPHVPDAVALAVIALFALASLLMLGLLWPRELRRRRKKGDEEFEVFHEPPRVPPWIPLALLLLVVLVAVAAGAAFWAGGSGSGPGAGARPLSGAPGGGGMPLRNEIGRPPASIPAFDIAVAALGIIGGAVVLGLSVWLCFGDRLAARGNGQVPDDPARSWRDAAVEGLEELRREPDARRAIVKCYRRFEQVLATARTPRAPWQTPTEFMRTVLARLAVPHEAVRMLTGLFELSRFSERRLGTTERNIACDCLEEIRTALEREEPDATAG